MYISMVPGPGEKRGPRAMWGDYTDVEGSGKASPQAPMSSRVSWNSGWMVLFETTWDGCRCWPAALTNPKPCRRGLEGRWTSKKPKGGHGAFLDNKRDSGRSVQLSDLESFRHHEGHMSLDCCPWANQALLSQCSSKPWSRKKCKTEALLRPCISTCQAFSLRPWSISIFMVVWGGQGFGLAMWPSNALGQKFQVCTTLLREAWII